ncbi:hypothetical protein J7363_04070 [Phaeobacter italicus]|nr:hypothetical protein [Phaeobacter italicus]
MSRRETGNLQRVNPAITRRIRVSECVALVVLRRAFASAPVSLRFGNAAGFPGNPIERLFKRLGWWSRALVEMRGAQACWVEALPAGGFQGGPGGSEKSRIVKVVLWLTDDLARSIRDVLHSILHRLIELNIHPGNIPVKNKNSHQEYFFIASDV